MEDLNKFNKNVNAPFMNISLKFKNKNELNAVRHIDNSSRIQTITKLNSPFLYKLLINFKKFKGYGALLNTSFNNNELIVNTPTEAIKTFYSTNLDILYLNNYKLTKEK